MARAEALRTRQSMAPQKTRAILLQILPYRESSGIVYLYTERSGLVHGIAKGIRRSGKQAQPFERGMLIECLVYERPQRSLHTLGSLAVLEYFPSLRRDLLCSAMRDAAFEMIIRSMHPDEPHQPLFDYLLAFLEHMDTGSAAFPFALWRFYLDFARLMGFGIDLSRCGMCGGVLRPENGCALIVERGLAACDQCTSPCDARRLPPALLIGTDQPGSSPKQLEQLPRAEQMRITRLLAAFCRHHFDLRSELRSLDFVCEII
ncbi:MAG: DNA repair protein RecO [Chitinivibrionales bacterium]|nr:DNA repair protein RecO [Chitinivibrionales bacterium]